VLLIGNFARASYVRIFSIAPEAAESGATSSPHHDG
jgi:hypothetical protein